MTLFDALLLAATAFALGFSTGAVVTAYSLHRAQAARYRGLFSRGLHQLDLLCRDGARRVADGVPARVTPAEAEAAREGE
jgi:hypothetical protein